MSSGVSLCVARVSDRLIERLLFDSQLLILSALIRGLDQSLASLILRLIQLIILLLLLGEGRLGGVLETKTEVAARRHEEQQSMDNVM
jgi:hypothetical protein